MSSFVFLIKSQGLSAKHPGSKGRTLLSILDSWCWDSLVKTFHTLADNFSSLCSESYHPSPVPPPKEAVDRFPIQMEDFLHGYFELLQNAGHHILHYLPDFNDSNIHHSSDFCSAVTNTTAVNQVWGIPTEKINEYLFTAWRNALILSSILTETLSTGPSLSLSQYHNSWSLRSSDSSLVIGFSAPTVSAVCEQEVLISFNIDEVEYGEHNE